MRAFLTLRSRKGRNALCLLGKITVKSGNEEFTLEVTEEEYQKYYRPWWQQKKHEQRNREAMEQNGYTEESYEEWRDNASEEVGIPDMELPGVDELVEKKLLLGVLADAMDSLLPEERELAMKVFGEEMQVSEFAKNMASPGQPCPQRRWWCWGNSAHFSGKEGWMSDIFHIPTKRILLSNGSEKVPVLLRHIFRKVSLRKVGGYISEPSKTAGKEEWSLWKNHRSLSASYRRSASWRKASPPS